MERIKLPRDPLDEPTRNRLISHFHEVAAKQHITPERALYNSARICGNSDDDLDHMYWMPLGSAKAWVDAHGLPPLDGVPTMEPV